MKTCLCICILSCFLWICPFKSATLPEIWCSLSHCLYSARGRIQTRRSGASTTLELAWACRCAALYVTLCMRYILYWRSASCTIAWPFWQVDRPRYKDTCALYTAYLPYHETFWWEMVMCCWCDHIKAQGPSRDRSNSKHIGIWTGFQASA